MLNSFMMLGVLKIVLNKFILGNSNLCWVFNLCSNFLFGSSRPSLIYLKIFESIYYWIFIRFQVPLYIISTHIYVLVFVREYEIHEFRCLCPLGIIFLCARHGGTVSSILISKSLVRNKLLLKILKICWGFFDFPF